MTIRQPNQPVGLSKDQLPTDIKLAYGRAAKRLFLFDYDGTLTAFAAQPHQAKPSPELLTRLDSLSRDQKNSIFIISGRSRPALEDWLGHLPLGLVAEHGSISKNETGWQPAIINNKRWKAAIKPIIEETISSVPGSKIEEKETAIVFHYRQASDQKEAEHWAEVLAAKLLAPAAAVGMDIRRDSREKIVEIKQASVSKGRVVSDLLSQEKYDFILCAGDSTSDEAMFEALAAAAFTIKVGPEPTAAKYRIGDPQSFVDWLANFDHKF